MFTDYKALILAALLSFLVVSHAQDVHTGGDVTFYDPAVGACGRTDIDTPGKPVFVVAMAWEMFDSYPGATANPNLNPICNQTIRVEFEGKSVEARVTDRCAGCNIRNSIDLSPSAFRVIADEKRGRLHGATWTFVGDKTNGGHTNGKQKGGDQTNNEKRFVRRHPRHFPKPPVAMS